MKLQATIFPKKLVKDSMNETVRVMPVKTSQ